MILQSLHQLYERLKDDEQYQIAPPGYSLQKIAFRVVLKPDGTLIEIQDIRIQEEKRMSPQQMLLPGGAKSSGRGLNPCFLWDNSGYMLGFKPDDPKPGRTTASFIAFREKHLAHEKAVNSPPYSAVCRFLENWDPLTAQDYPILTDLTTGFGVFQLQGKTRYIHNDPAVTRWWEKQAGETGSAEDQCLITGDIAPVAKTHPKIKGVQGAQSSGATIVGFNETAYESYGKKQSYNASISESAAFRYTTALNSLLDGPMKSKHRLSVGGTTVVFWTDRPTATEDIFAAFASGDSSAFSDDEVQDETVREKVEIFLQALRKGKEAYGDLDDNSDRTSFSLLGLSPNAARISIRFFYKSTLSELLENLRKHYKDIRTRPEPAHGKRKGDPEFPPIWLLLRQTARESKEIPPIIAGPLLRAIITGARYPASLYSGVIRRIHADRTMNYARACVIKGYLKRNLNQEVDMSLNIDRPDPAYRIGRLFATLEKTQRDALGLTINATIRDRFYSSASATPRVVFPRLLRTYQHHLAKLEGGRKVNREKLVQEILEPLEEFPAQLDLTGQGQFALGYYHQTQAFYTKKENEN